MRQLCRECETNHRLAASRDVTVLTDPARLWCRVTGQRSAPGSVTGAQRLVPWCVS